MADFGTKTGIAGTPIANVYDATPALTDRVPITGGRETAVQDIVDTAIALMDVDTGAMTEVLGRTVTNVRTVRTLAEFATDIAADDDAMDTIHAEMQAREVEAPIELTPADVDYYQVIDNIGVASLITPAISMDAMLAAPGVPAAIGATATFLPAGTGAVATTLQSKFREFVSVKDFGAIGDNDYNNAPALTLLKNFINTKDEHSITNVLFPPGIYKIGDPAWSLGMTSGIRMIGDNATLQASFPSPSSYIQYLPFCLTGLFITVNTITGADVVDDTPLIETAPVGQDFIVLKTPAETALYSEGDYILIHGYMQQLSSGPPNCLYFERKQITAINAGTGQIDLSSPLIHAYRDDWPLWKWYPSPAIYGGPAAIVIDRRTPFFGMDGFKIIDHPDSSGDIAVIPGGLVQEIKNCYFPAMTLACGSAERIVIDNVTCKGIEVDKLTDEVVVINAKSRWSTGGVVACTGTKRVRIHGGEMSNIYASPIHLLDIDGVTISDDSAQGALIYPYAKFKTDLVKISNIKPSAGSTRLFQEGADYYTTVVAFADNVMKIAKTDANLEFCTGLRKGYLLWKNLHGKIGRVTGDVTEDATHILIPGRWYGGDPVADELWVTTGLANVEILNSNGFRVPKDTGIEMIRPMIHYSRNFNYASTGNNLISYFVGNITSMDIDVIVPYAGSTASVLAGLACVDGALTITTWCSYLNLKVAGRRHWDGSVWSNLQTGDTLTAPEAAPIAIEFLFDAMADLPAYTPEVLVTIVAEMPI